MPAPTLRGRHPGCSLVNIVDAFQRSTTTVRNTSSRSTRSWLRLAALVALLPFVVAGSGGFAPMQTGGLFKLVRRDEGDLIRFFVENFERAEVTATFDLTYVNLSSSKAFPFTASFPPNQTTEAFVLAPLKNGQEWRYTLTNYFTLGSAHAVHDDSVVYSLPYEAEREFRVSQGYHGEFSHTGTEEYAIDWKMPEGTPVLAARAGLVIGLKDDSDRGGSERRFEHDANYILIQHSDLTIGNYAHLAKGGAKVSIGQRVERGQILALSGNTGFSSGPHLHFCVFQTLNGKQRQSIPIRFKTAEGVGITLQSGRSYRTPTAVSTATPILSTISVR